MRDEIKIEVLEFQTSMEKSARDCFFGESELDALRCIIRIAVEFRHFVQRANMDSPVQHELEAKLRDAFDTTGEYKIEKHDFEYDLEYNIETTFSGIDSFRSLCNSYDVLTGATSSNIDWGVISPRTLKSLYISKYGDFATESDFLKKYRHLLDLFKIQIVFTGLLYG